MPLQTQDIQRIAQLARLEVSPTDLPLVQEQLNAFFALVEQMKAVDTSDVAPLAQPLSVIQDVHLRLADDEVHESNQRTAHQRSAPAIENGLFVVPKVIE